MNDRPRDAPAMSTQAAAGSGRPGERTAGGAARAREHQRLRNAYARGEALPGGRHVLVAAMPKSGSSLMIRMVAELPGFRRIAVVRGHDRRENELALDTLVRSHDVDWVAQAHVRHSTATARLAGSFGLRTVVQTRELADTLVSIHDHLLNIAAINPIAEVPPAFPHWPRERRLAFVVDLFAPWYLHFFISWRDAGDVLRVDYADLLRDPALQLSRVVAFAGIPADAAQVRAACERAHSAAIPTRNRIVEGRGRELPPAARRQLLRLAGYYAGYDLSPLGL